MQLPNLFAAQQIPHVQLFFVVLLTETHAQGALWKIEEGRIDVLTQSTQHQWQDEETCVNAIDHALQELGKESENVKQTLFALQSNWVSAEGIVPARKPLFQKITKELSLEAIGFVVVTEALLQHFTETVSPQVNLFLIDVRVQEIEVSLVKQGQLVDSCKVGRSGESVSDVNEAFAHFKEKSFPAKFILFSPILTEEELQEVRQQLFSEDWPKRYPFLHPPLIDVFPSDELLAMIVRTGGKAVAESRGLVAKMTAEPEVATEEVPVEPTVDPVEEPIEEPLEKEKEKEEESNLTAVDLETEPTLASSFGVPIAIKDVEKDVPADIAELKNNLPKKTRSMPKISFSAFTRFLPFKISSKNVVPFVLVGVLCGVGMLWLIAMVAANSALQTLVTLQVTTKVVNKDVKLTLDSKVAASDPEKLILKANIVNKEVTGEKSAETTGTKVIGDKAKGKVTMFNRTTSPKSFPAGTTLTSGKAKLLLDEAITVEAASTGQNFETKPGTADVAVTAAQIGEDSNLGKDIDLVVETFSKDTYVARTATEITGGASREIQAVSQEDRTKLQAALTKELLEQATQTYKQESKQGQYFIPTNRVKVAKSEFNGEVGKELNSLSLTLTVQVEALSYQIADLQPLALKVLTSEVPAGYHLSNKDPQILSAPVSNATTAAQVMLQASLTSEAKPDVNVDDLRKEIAGKNAQEAQELLKQKSEIKQAELTQTPFFLTWFSRKVSSSPEKTKITITNE
jgi:hypothetical protein